MNTKTLISVNGIVGLSVLTLLTVAIIAGQARGHAPSVGQHAAADAGMVPSENTPAVFEVPGERVAAPITIDIRFDAGHRADDADNPPPRPEAQ